MELPRLSFFPLHIALFVSICLVCNVNGGAIQLNSNNMDQLLGSNELVFVNFYANWCRFSQMLEPIYDEFADKLAKELPADSKVSVGKVDCDVESQIAQKNQISKYPTLKLYRNGLAVKKEYRGARTADAFVSFIKEQLASSMKIETNIPKIESTLQQQKKRALVGYFENEESENFKAFKKLANTLRDSAVFIAGVGPLLNHKRTKGDKVVFRDIGSIEHDEVAFDGNLDQADALFAWANEKCSPLVREITFENAEELTEEGLPFLILFHKPDDIESVKKFQNEVQRQLIHMKGTINAVHADGLKFSHPLNHLGKSANDLPILAIDSFRHMYIFPDYNKFAEGDNLVRFVQDLHSGKLHREFHNGPDPTSEPPKQIEMNKDLNHIPKGADNQLDDAKRKSTPPESVFIKLAPSRDRYSLKHDGEL